MYSPLPKTEKIHNTLENLNIGVEIEINIVRLPKVIKRFNPTR